MNRSAWLGDATGVGHLPHHVSGVAGLRRPGLEIRLPLDAEENSKWVCVCLCLDLSDCLSSSSEQLKQSVFFF